MGTKFCQKIRFQEPFKKQSEKVTFSSIFQVPKKIQNNSRNSKNSRTDSHADNTVSHNTIFS